MTVLDKQTMADITIQEYGKLDHLFDVALGVGKGITDVLEAGEVLVLPAITIDAAAARVVSVLQRSENKPANGVDVINNNGGIGFMQIGNSFIVS